MRNFKRFLFIYCISVSGLLGADDEVQSFQCAIEKDTSSCIFLVGESHDSPLGNRARNILNNLACEGKAYLGVEGLEGKKIGFRLDATCGKGKTKNALIYGLESELSLAFTGAIHAYRYLVYALKYEKHLVPEKKITFLLAISNTEISKDAWKRASKEKEHDFPKFITLLNKFINQYEKNNDVPVDFIKQLMTNPDFMNNERACVELTKAFAREVGLKLQEYLELSDKEFSNFFDFLEDPLKGDITNLTIGYRDTVMAQNLAKLYCKAQLVGKVVYAIVGKDHIEGIKEQLITASGGLIQIGDWDLTLESEL